MKKGLSIVLSLVMLLSVFVIDSFTVTATESNLRESETISNDIFSVLNPIPDGDYYVNKEIDVQINVKDFCRVYNEAGIQTNSMNYVSVRFFETGSSLWKGPEFTIYEDNVGETLSKNVTLTKEGEYKVEVRFAQENESEMTHDESLVSSYTINVKSSAISNAAFDILNPTVYGDYTVNEVIEIQVNVKRFYSHYLYGLLLPNVIKLEFIKNNEVVHTQQIQYKSAVGKNNAGEFTPTEAGEYTVHASLYDGTIVSGTTSRLQEKDMGSYTFTVKSDITFICGDADGDGEIAAIDVTQIMRSCAHSSTGIDKDVMMNADVDGNGLLEITDATYIQRYLARQQTPYAIGQKK